MDKTKLNKLLLVVVEECKRELDSLAIPYSKNIVKVEVNTRAKSRWGQTRKRGNVYEININVDLLSGKCDYQNGLKNTIIHELLHTCPNCMEHKNQWLAYANKVNNAYGYRITRCNSAEDKGFSNYYEEVAAERKTEYKYFIKCSKCGHKIGYKRKCDSVNRPYMYIHKPCEAEFMTA